MRSFAIVLLLVAACHPQAEPLTYEGAEAKNLAGRVEHGRRLTFVLSCVGCHGVNLQGKNMADKPEDGAMYSPNITLLMPTYSDADFDQLLRHGVPKDHRRFWFMQVETYQFLSDPDVADLIAYLRTLKPAGEQQPAFKFNAAEYKDVQQGILGDAKTQIRKYRANQPVDMGPENAWGRYMVQSSCTGCHNNALQGWPNFTPNLDIAGAYSKAELTRLLTNGQGKQGKDVGPMSGIARTYFSHLTPRERDAIVSYILARANRSQSAGVN
jgi:mono/diheme cytochrome c family protein